MTANDIIRSLQGEERELYAAHTSALMARLDAEDELLKARRALSAARRAEKKVGRLWYKTEGSKRISAAWAAEHASARAAKLSAA